MVMNMMDDIKEHVKDYADEEEIAAYLDKLPVSYTHLQHLSQSLHQKLERKNCQL